MVERAKPGLRVVTDAGRRVSDEPLHGDDVTIVEDFGDVEVPDKKAEVQKLLRTAFDRVEDNYQGVNYTGAIVVIIGDPEDGSEPRFQLSLTDDLTDVQALGFLELSKSALLGLLPDVTFDEDETDQAQPPAS